MAESGVIINIIVNGEGRSISPRMTIDGLLRDIGLAGKAVAVEVNREIVPKNHHRIRIVEDGDQIELVTLVGGG